MEILLILIIIMETRILLIFQLEANTQFKSLKFF
jgi:hypothetical protein